MHVSLHFNKSPTFILTFMFSHKQDPEPEPPFTSNIGMEEAPVTYSIVEGESSRRKRKLFDSDGFDYIFKSGSAGE